jgi:hypothetical protein
MKKFFFWVALLQFQIGFSQCITIQPADASICQNDNATTSFSLTASGTSLTYQWQISDITGTIWSSLTNNANYSGVSNSSISVTGLSGTSQTLSYRCLVSDNNVLCGTSNSVNLIVKPKPTITSSGTSSICSGNDANIALNNSLGNASASFSWSRAAVAGVTPNTGNGNSANILETLNNTTATNKTVNYIATTTTNGCTSNAINVTLEIKAKPAIANFSNPSASICSGDAFSTFNAAVGSNIIPNGTTYTWSNPSTSITGTSAGNVAITFSQGMLSQSTSTNQTVNFSITPSANGCVGNAFTFSIEVKPKANITNFSTPFSICTGDVFNTFNAAVGSNVVPSGTTYTWSNPTSSVTGTTAGSAASNFSQGSLTHAQNTNQSINYSITPTSNGCIGTVFTLIIQVKPKANIANFTNPFSICTGDVFNTFNAAVGSNVVPSGTTYTWINPTSSVSGTSAGNTASNFSQGSLTHSQNTTQSINYSISPTSNGCVGTIFTLSIQVKPRPVITTKSGALCSGLAFSINPTNGSGDLVPSNTLYTWSTPSSSNLSGMTAGTNQSNFTQTLNNTTSSNQTITYSVTPVSSGCSGNSFSINLTIFNEPTPNVSSNTTICAGNSTQLFADGGVNYEWTPTINMNFPFINDPIVNPAVTTTYTVEVVGVNGCSASRTIVITVSSNPTISNSPSATSICSEQAFTFSPSVGSGTTFSWIRENNGAYSSSPSNGSGNINHVLYNELNFPTSVTYQFQLTNSNGCTNNINFAVTVHPKPQLTNAVNFPTALCSQESFSFTPSFQPSGTFSWSRNTPANITTTSAISGTTNLNNHSFINNSGNDISVLYQMTLISSAACTTTQSLPIVIHPNVVLNNNTTSSESICSGNQWNYFPSIANNLSNAIISWTLNVPTGLVSNGSNQGQDNIELIMENSGGSSLQATATFTGNANGCNSLPVNVTLTVYPLPIVTHTIPSSVCSDIGIAATLTSNVMNTNFSWSFTPQGNVNLMNGSLNGSIATITQTWNNPTSTASSILYEITPTSQQGCQGNTLQGLISILPKPILTNSPLNAEVCSGNNFEFTPTWENNNTIFNWTRTLSAGLSSSSPASGNSTINQIFNNSNNTASNANFTVSAQLQGCAASYPFALTVFPTPPVYNELPIAFCPENNWDIQLNNWSDSQYSISWSPSSFFSNPASSNTTFLGNATTTVFVTATNNFGCTKTQPVPIQILSSPSSAFSYNTETCEGDFITLSAENANYAEYQWIDGSTIINSTLSNSSILATMSNTITLTVHDENGCTSSTANDYVVHALPNNTIQGDSTFCANSTLVSFSTSFDQNLLYHWSIDNGYIAGGQGLFTVYANLGIGNSANIFLSTENEWGCSYQDTLTLQFSGEADSTAFLLLLGSNTLAHPNDSYEFYLWGKTNITSLIETSETTNLQYYNFGNIDISSFYYWVETSNSEGCVTRSYWNAPVIANDIHHTNAEILSIYPNPVQHTLHIVGDKINEVSIVDMTGNLIGNQRNTTEIDVSTLANGLYVIQVTTHHKTTTLKFLKI